MLEVISEIVGTGKINWYLFKRPASDKVTKFEFQSKNFDSLKYSESRVPKLLWKLDLETQSKDVAEGCKQCVFMVVG